MFRLSNVHLSVYLSVAGVLSSGLIQFCLSAPKTDMENNIVITDYSQMDRMLREERLLIAKMVKHIAATGCNCLLIQKSILRDAVNVRPNTAQLRTLSLNSCFLLTLTVHLQFCASVTR